MQLADRRFGGEAVTTTGKVYPFDDVGCLGTFVAMGGIPGEELYSLWVVDFLNADSLLAVADAVFLHSDSVKTPMQYGLAALRPGGAADSLAEAWNATRLDWREVLARLGPAGP
jgi:copper chaperone NosL